jgi:hypothetical protein
MTLSVAGLEHGKWTMTASSASARAMVREVHGTNPATVVARDYASIAQLRALAALTGRSAPAAGAVTSPVRGAAAAMSGAGTVPSDLASFTLLSPATPARWHEADSGAPVYVDTQRGGHPQIPGGGLTQLARATRMWRAAGQLVLQTDGSRGPRCFYNSEPSDGRISLTYGDPCGEISDESWTLAVGGVYDSSSDLRAIDGVDYWKIVKGMIVADNAEWKYAGMSTGCYEEIVAHEIGHAIGFGHAAARPALMYPSISPDCSSRHDVDSARTARFGVGLDGDDHVDRADGRPGAAGLRPLRRYGAGADQHRRCDDDHDRTGGAPPCSTAPITCAWSRSDPAARRARRPTCST